MLKYEYKLLKFLQLMLLIIFSFFLCFCDSNVTYNPWDDIEDVENPDNPEEPIVKNKSCYVWIDMGANFSDYANSKENIERDLKKIKDCGFTDIVVDVRSTTGDILYKSSLCPQVKYMFAWKNGVYSKVERNATWDYLQAFIDVGHKEGLRVHAAFNTFIGGRDYDGGMGLLFRDPSKKDWATSYNTSNGVINAMDLNKSQLGSDHKFLNPAHPEVQDYLCGLLADLAKYDIDGIILDRGRYWNLLTDFSEISKKQFETFIGYQITNFPSDLIVPGTTYTTFPQNNLSSLQKDWLAYRAKVIRDFMQKARNSVKQININIKFGVYVGGWYSQYFDVGVNWASSNYDAASEYKWANRKYNMYGYADLMDQIIIGAYANPSAVYGNTEWTMQGFCRLAMKKIKGACPLVVGGPDVGNWDPNDNYSTEVENQAITNSVKACADQCNGYFLFDLIHIKNANQWKYVKEGISEINISN